MPEQGRIEDGWCILRTSPGRTLALARSLGLAGFDVWTPTETILRPKTRRRPAEERPAPIMPTFVFARSDHAAALAAICAQPLNPHPAFSLFRYGNGIPVVAEREIAGLRAEEERAKRRALKGQRHTFRIGQRVTVPEGSWVGLTGIVQACDGKWALVCFGGAIPVQVATYLIEVDEGGTDAIQSAHSPRRTAA